MAELRADAHRTAQGEELEILTVTVRDLELVRREMIYGQPVEMRGVVPVVNVEHYGRPGQDRDKLAARLEAKVRKNPDDPSRWVL